MSIDEKRTRIDAIDDEILGLLDERARLARAIGDEKSQQGEDLDRKSTRLNSSH